MGVVERGAVKINDDFGQMLQMLFFDNAPQASPMTAMESRVVHLPDELMPAVVEAQRGTPAYAELKFAQKIAMGQIEKREREETEKARAGWARFAGRPVRGGGRRRG